MLAKLNSWFERWGMAVIVAAILVSEITIVAALMMHDHPAPPATIRYVGNSAVPTVHHYETREASATATFISQAEAWGTHVARQDAEYGNQPTTRGD